MSQSSPATPPRIPRKFRAVLLVSLAFNLLFVGLVVGMVIKGPPQGHDRGRAENGGRNFYSQALNREDRRILRDRMRAEGLNLGEGRAKVRSNVTAIVATLRADPYDPAAFAIAMQGQDSTMEMMRIKGQQILVDHVNGMDAAGRAEFANRLEETLKRGPKR